MDNAFEQWNNSNNNSNNNNIIDKYLVFLSSAKAIKLSPLPLFISLSKQRKKNEDTQDCFLQLFYNSSCFSEKSHPCARLQ